MNCFRTLWVLVGVAFAPRALAQDAGVTDAGAGAGSPVTVVQRAPGVRRLQASQRYRLEAPRDFDLPLRTARGECFEVAGYATGASRVTVQVFEGSAALGSPVPLTNSTGALARRGFCATLGGPSYRVQVHADGPAWWALAVLVAPRPAGPAPSGADAGASVMDAAAPSDAPDGGPRRAGPAPGGVPVGGPERDYVGARLRAWAAEHPGSAGFTDAVRVTLNTNQTYDQTLQLGSGQCVAVVVAGVPSVADLVLELFDPVGNRVALDATHTSLESVRHCAAYAGPVRFRARMFSGAGLVGVQALTVP
ncbi:MAG: hypothetical protein HY909_21990 [Deltaproteobacteria bacterium]|nr:hypothetical protein [Deltaproteobacteria bacterium]